MKKLLSLLLTFALLFTINIMAMAENTSELQSFTLEELAQYNGKDGAKAYVAVNGIVYDVTDSKAWSNGAHNSVQAGTDVTEWIGKAPHSEDVLKPLPVVGKIVEKTDESATAEKKETFNLYTGVTALQQRPFEFNPYKGKNLVVSFWTTWCPHCTTEIPDFAKFKQEHMDDVSILMVHVPDRSEITDAQKMFDEKGYTDLLALENDDFTYAGAFGVQGYPTNLVFDKEGNLVYYGHALSYDNLNEIFTKANLF